MRARLRYMTLEDVLFDTRVKNTFLLSHLSKFFGGVDIDVDIK